MSSTENLLVEVFTQIFCELISVNNFYFVMENALLDSFCKQAISEKEEDMKFFICNVT